MMVVLPLGFFSRAHDPIQASITSPGAGGAQLHFLISQLKLTAAGNGGVKGSSLEPVFSKGCPLTPAAELDHQERIAGV